MEVYLLRHGAARNARPSLPDADRELAPEGARDVERVAQRARAAGAAPALILSSTYRRAVESAEIAARALGYRGAIERTAALHPDGSPFEAWDEVRKRGPEGPVLLVAHEPLMSGIAALLLDAPTLRIRFTPACLMAIEVERPGAQPNGLLRWMIVPALV